MKIDIRNALLMGIEKYLNSVPHIDFFREEGENLWSLEIMNHPHNLVLNRIDDGLVISSLVFFADEFCCNMFILRHLWNESNESLATTKYGLIN